MMHPRFFHSIESFMLKVDFRFSLQLHHMCFSCQLDRELMEKKKVKMAIYATNTSSIDKMLKEKKNVKTNVPNSIVQEYSCQFIHYITDISLNIT